MKKTVIVFISILFIFLSGCGENDSIKQNSKLSPTKSENESVVVYITKTGECYHRYNCSCLQYSKFERKLSEVANKYRPCQICRPPVIGE